MRLKRKDKSVKHRAWILTAALALSVLLLTAVPTMAAAQVCGTKVDGYSVQLGLGAELTETTFWTGRSLRTEHFVTCKPGGTLHAAAATWDTLCSTGSVNAMEQMFSAQGVRSIAAVNGGFYTISTKEPSGLVVQDGILRADDEGFCAVGFRADGSTVIGLPKLQMQLASESTTVAVDALNKGYGEGIVLYTADFFSGKVIGGWNVLCTVDGPITMSGSTILTVKSVTDEAVKIPEGQILIHSADSTAPIVSNLTVGEILTLNTSCAPGWETVESALGILYKLVTNGTPESGLETSAAPRSAIGVKADGTIVLYTMDGRQSEYSVGIGMDVLARRMAELGCVEAGCLDGGGSTNLCAALPGDSCLTGVGKPSDGSARSVASYIFLVSDKTVSSGASALALYPLHINAMVGASQQLTVKATDGNGNAASVPAGVTYSVSGGIGEVVNGVFYAKKAGTGQITISAPGKQSASIPIKVVAAPDEMVLYGEKYGRLTTSLTLEPGEEVDLTVKAKSSHVSLLTADEGFTWVLSPEAGTVDQTGHLIPAENSGIGKLTVSAGNKKVEIPITIRAAIPFYDVSKSDSYYEAVKYVYDNSIFLGTSDTTFEPLTVMNRAMLVTVLWRLSGEPTAETKLTFADVSGDSWYGPAVAWAVENGIVTGYSAKAFGPGDDLTKEQILTILCRWSGEEAPTDPILGYTDTADAGSWAISALAWATAPERQLVDADENGALLPRQPMTRAAVADVLMRYLK